MNFNFGMRYIRQHIGIIIKEYDGRLPLAHFLKIYFKKNPKLGSRDRKILSEMAYCWYRCNKGIETKYLEFDEKVNACLFLCSINPKLIESFLPDAWIPELGRNVSERLELLKEHNIHFNINRLFPFENNMSTGITKDDWELSMLTQPLLFIRIRKYKKKAIALLTENNISFEFINDTCAAIQNGAAVDKILPEDMYVVQDASSQETGKYFNPIKGQKWYDCCSGAGGKSLLLKDIEPGVHLTVSDVRESILHNLKERFKTYHHALPIPILLDVADKAKTATILGNKQFDSIICDVPCTGSGTWARTPEQLYFFDPIQITKISTLQKAIAINMASYLTKDGKLIYITCSIFKEENEHVVKEIVSRTGLKLKKMHLINGIQNRADSMFIAVLSNT